MSATTTNSYEAAKVAAPAKDDGGLWGYLRSSGPRVRSVPTVMFVNLRRSFR